MTASSSGARQRTRGPGRSLRLASATTALWLGGLALLLLLAAIPLEALWPGTLAAFNGSGAAGDATGVALVLVFAGVGVVVARRQPRNPIGWLLLLAAIAWEVGNYSPAYVDLDYLVHHGSLPLGHVALLLTSSDQYGLLILPVIILLFPTGTSGGAGAGRFAPTSSSASSMSRRRWRCRSPTLRSAFRSTVPAR